MTKKRLLERIVGALLVSAFCFILYSIFLDSETENYIDRSTQIPVMPEFIEPLEIEETVIVIQEPEKNVQDIFIPKEEVSPQQALESQALEISSIQSESAADNGLVESDLQEEASESQLSGQEQLPQPNAWVIQVGSFSGIEKAEALVGQLLAESFKAYHRDLSRDNLYRVLVGPYVDAEQAVRDQRQVDEILGLSTLLMKFEP